jgi:hypothetical protein
MFWRKKLAHSRRAAVPRAVLQNPELDWQFYAALSQRNSYDTNLIKNGCGELVEVPTLSLTDPGPAILFYCGTNHSDKLGVNKFLSNYIFMDTGIRVRYRSSF